MLELKNIFFGYEPKHELFHDLSLTLQPGTFNAITGPSGSGKSTLFKLITGRVVPQSGSISGVEKNIQQIYQDYRLLPFLSVQDNLLLTAELLHHNSVQADKQSVQSLLTKVGIEQSLWQQQASLCSGGEQQRIAIARALLAKPQILLADEPTGALDTVNTIAIAALFHQLVREEKATVLVATHDLQVAAYADNWYLLEDKALVKKLTRK